MKCFMLTMDRTFYINRHVYPSPSFWVSYHYSSRLVVQLLSYFFSMTIPSANFCGPDQYIQFWHHVSASSFRLAYLKLWTHCWHRISGFEVCRLCEYPPPFDKEWLHFPKAKMSLWRIFGSLPIGRSCMNFLRCCILFANEHHGDFMPYLEKKTHHPPDIHCSQVELYLF